VVITNWSALAHRALAAATLHGLLPRAPRVVCWREDRASDARGNVVVAGDAPALGAFDALRSAMDGADAIIAVVIASTSAAALVQARAVDTERTDAFARAAIWARTAAAGPLAQAVSAARLREIVTSAEAAGLVLVEPELPSTLARLTPSPRSSVARAIVTAVALGATARPLLFVPAQHAPKGGLAKLRVERALDGWIEGRAGVTAARTSLLGAALEALAGAPGPMRGKELLREARTRWAETTRATASTADGPALARDLVTAWHDGAIELYALDPATRF
jgi:hypothetical protein